MTHRPATVAGMNLRPMDQRMHLLGDDGEVQEVVPGYLDTPRPGDGKCYHCWQTDPDHHGGQLFVVSVIFRPGEAELRIPVCRAHVPVHDPALALKPGDTCEWMGGPDRLDRCGEQALLVVLHLDQAKGKLGGWPLCGRHALRVAADLTEQVMYRFEETAPAPGETTCQEQDATPCGDPAVTTVRVIPGLFRDGELLYQGDEDDATRHPMCEQHHDLAVARMRDEPEA
jgi:hypothetical protein